MITLTLELHLFCRILYFPPSSSALSGNSCLFFTSSHLFVSTSHCLILLVFFSSSSPLFLQFLSPLLLVSTSCQFFFLPHCLNLYHSFPPFLLIASPRVFLFLFSPAILYHPAFPPQTRPFIQLSFSSVARLLYFPFPCLLSLMCLGLAVYFILYFYFELVLLGWYQDCKFFLFTPTPCFACFAAW